MILTISCCSKVLALQDKGDVAHPGSSPGCCRFTVAAEGGSYDESQCLCLLKEAIGSGGTA